MKTTEPLGVPGLPRDAGDPKINAFCTELVRKYHVVLTLEDEADENGNCVIIATHGDPEVLAQLTEEVNSRKESE